MDEIQNNIYRINDYSLLELTDSDSTKYFNTVLKNTQISKQFFTNVFLSQYVWETSGQFRKINKLFDTEFLITEDSDGVIKDLLEYSTCDLLLKQGFDWSRYMGLHVIIKSSKNDDTLFSALIPSSYFNINKTLKSYEDSLWPEVFTFTIPKIDDVKTCQVTPIEFGKIDMETMEMYDFPTEFVPLINEKPLPEYIKLLAEIDENGFLKLETKTSENKTLESSLLYYFGLELANINISYIIQYGNEHLFKKVKISNDYNTFKAITLGLNFVEFLDEVLNPEQIITLYITLQITVNSMVINRQTTLTYDSKQLNPIIQNQMVKPEIIYPVEVINETIIRPTIIEAKETNKFIKIIQPIFVEMLIDDIVIERKNITFNNLTQSAYLVIAGKENDKEQVIISDVTSDNVFYFDLTKATALTTETTYKILLAHNHSIIGQGICYQSDN